MEFISTHLAMLFLYIIKGVKLRELLQFYKIFL